MFNRIRTKQPNYTGKLKPQFNNWNYIACPSINGINSITSNTSCVATLGNSVTYLRKHNMFGVQSELDFTNPGVSVTNVGSPVGTSGMITVSAGSPYASSLSVPGYNSNPTHTYFELTQTSYQGGNYYLIRSKNFQGSSVYAKVRRNYPSDYYSLGFSTAAWSVSSNKIILAVNGEIDYYLSNGNFPNFGTWLFGATASLSAVRNTMYMWGVTRQNISETTLMEISKNPWESMFMPYQKIYPVFSGPTPVPYAMNPFRTRLKNNRKIMGLYP